MENKYDVVVVGGGTAGIASAIASARHGARTLLLERNGFLGGNATLAMVPALCAYSDYDGPVVTGIPLELLENMLKLGGATDNRGREYPFSSFSYVDMETLKYVTETMVLEAGAQICFNTLVVGVLKTDNRVSGIEVETGHGRQRIEADVVIDCTGDGEVAALAGAEYAFGREEDGRVMGSSMMIRIGGVTKKLTNPHEDCAEITALLQPAMENNEIIHYDRVFVEPLPRKGEAFINTTTLFGNPIDTQVASDWLWIGRRHAHCLVQALNKYVPGCENAYITQTGSQIGVRESRRVLGDYVLTEEDVKSAARFSDGVAWGAFQAIDIHRAMPDEKPIFDKFYSGAYHIPYRCLLPKGLDGILVAGRCLSADRPAFASARMMVNCMSMGQAAGTAAAMAVSQKKQPRQLDACELIDTLRADDVNL